MAHTKAKECQGVHFFEKIKNLFLYPKNRRPVKIVVFCAVLCELRSILKKKNENDKKKTTLWTFGFEKKSDHFRQIINRLYLEK